MDNKKPKELNSIRVPVNVLRQIAVELTQHGLEDIGLEDLLLAIRARVRKSGIDT